MKTYTLKSVARRGSMLTAALVVAVAAFIPAASSFADALNPLTERSLTLSSSSPGWSYLDGSGNDTYAEPNSGANGRKTGNTFSFRVSSDSPSGDEVKGITFQYCTAPAGDCTAPGDIPFVGTVGSYTRADNDDATLATKKSDLQVVVDALTVGEVDAVTYGANFNASTGAPSNLASVPDRDGSDGNFIVLHKAPADANWSHSAGWDMVSTENQTTGGNGTPGALVDGTSTGKENYITLTNSTGQELDAGDYVKVIFFGTDDNYITNPGSGAFFVKINTYDDDTTQDDTTLIDGGVTVANVMNRSIEIQTKVLETMDFSVGTVDPNTLDSTGGAGSQYQLATGSNDHGVCDPIVQGMTSNTTTPNVLQLGDAAAEFSLRTDTTYSTHSYWRLSSNSSAGATVYYSGVTLSNTVGDQIDAINGGSGTKASPSKGTEQFGLALDNGTSGPYAVSYAKERFDNAHLFQNGADNAVSGLHTASLTDDGVLANGSWHDPQLAPLAPTANYGDGTGVVNPNWNGGSATVDTEFAFDVNSNLIPTAIATGTQVVDCVTAKVRYIANIAATTPAGIYTTKINYIASPKY